MWSKYIYKKIISILQTSSSEGDGYRPFAILAESESEKYYEQKGY